MERLQFFHHSRADGSINLTLLFDSSRVLDNYKNLLTEHSTPGDETAGSGSVGTTSKPLLCFYRALFTIHQLVNQETRLFIEKAFERASDIV